MFISGESGLPLSLLIKRIPPSNFDDNIMFFSRASGGMEFFLRSTGVNPKKKKVLLPNYICWDFVKNIVKSGYEPVFYEIDGTFNPILADLFRRMSPEIFAVVIVHYFGFYCPLTEKIVGRCRENGIYAVEDCAHLMYGKDIRKNIKGDVAIFSLKKQFPIPDGGILYDNTGVVEGKNSLREIPQHKLNIGKNTSKLILKYYIQKINFVKKKYSPIDDDMESMSYLKIKRISGLSENLFMKICLNGYGSLIIDRRRENFNHLMSIFHLNSDLSISLTFKNLNEKDTPYFFPIRMNHNAYTIINGLRNDGIPVISWPALDKNHENFSSAESIRSNFIFFPLHEGILEHHLEYMVKAFKDKVALC